jgi:hypothetical protein
MKSSILQGKGLKSNLPRLKCSTQLNELKRITQNIKLERTSGSSSTDLNPRSNARPQFRIGSSVDLNEIERSRAVETGSNAKSEK